MITQEQVRTVIGGTLYGSDDQKIGKIGQVFVDDESGRPEWVTVHTGLFGTNESFVPVSDGSVTGDDIRVPFSKDQVKDAPNVDPSAGHLSEQEEDELYRYYGMSRSGVRGSDDDATTSGYTDTTATAGYRDATTGDATTGAGYTGDASYTGATGTTGTTDYTDSTRGAGHDTSGPNTDDAMTRSEEHLRAGTETVDAGRARLRKWVETEEQTVTVPVTREKARLVTEPITDANRDAAYSGGDITEEEHEVTLREERAVVTTETVPVERVRLETETETRQETVSGEVRKEHIDLDDDSKIRGDVR